MRRICNLTFALAAMVIIMTSTPAEAGCKLFGRHRARACQPPGYSAGGWSYSYSAWGTAASPAPPADPAGFLGWLNGVRARSGCAPVAWDPNLAAWAAANSAAGFGHSVRFGRRQNAGVGSMEQVCSGWLASPGHCAALLDPSITRVGVACVGSVWTFEGD